MRLYLCGPTEKIPNRNAREFEHASMQLKSKGYGVASPVRMTSEGQAMEAAMNTRLAELLRCKGVALMQGWSRSRSVRLELDVAFACGKDVRWLESWLDDRPREWDDIVPTDVNGEALE